MENFFSPWKEEVIKLVKEKIELLKVSYRPPKRNCVLDDSDARQALDQLHNQFVVCPIDKASGNMAFVCKRFYAQVLFMELGILGNANNTYSCERKSVQTVVASHKKMMKAKFGLCLEEDNECLPHMYWLPK